MARRKSRRRKATTRKRGRRRNPTLFANPRRRRVRRRAVARSRRRSRRRRNPPAIVNMIMRGLQDAGAVVAGEMGANIIANQIPMILKEPGAAGAAEVETKAGVLLRKVLAAAGVGVAAQMLFKGRSDIVRFAVAGALSAPIKAIVRPLLPATGPFAGSLSAGGRLVRMAAYPGRVGAYPRLMAGMGAYPRDDTTLAGDSAFYGYN